MKTIQVGLLGFGTVGSGVAKILLENKDVITGRLGAEVNLKWVADLDLTTDRGVALPDGVLISNAMKVLEDPDIDIIVETIGGETNAKKFILKAIENGKQVVTANKALIASHGNEIFMSAQEKNVDIAFEASVGGCMPIIKTLRESLGGNRILSMRGILNGTCNYILSKITQEKSLFKDALRQAQKKGYAEADPTLDVEGFDTAHKIAILSALAYGTEINYNDVYIEGITHITPFDIETAAQFGYTIKLLAISKMLGDKVEVRVHPTMIPSDDILSSVSGSLNAITVKGDAVGDILLSGFGAGMMPTASAVVSDIMDQSRSLLEGARPRLPLLAFQKSCLKKVPILPIEEIVTQYYFRFSVLDRPGVLSKISGILGDNDISIRTVLQKGRKAEGSVPIVMLTHPARGSQVKKALELISQSDEVLDETIIIRIEDENGDGA